MKPFKVSQAWTMLARFLWRFRPAFRKAFIANALGVLSTLCQLSIPLTMIAIINKALPQRDYDLLMRYAALMAIASALSVILSYIETYYTIVFRTRASLILEILLFDRIQRQPADFFKSKDGGYIMSRMSNDNGTALTAVVSVASIGRPIVMLLSGFVLLRMFDLKLGVLIAVILPLYASMLLFFSLRTRRAYINISEKTALASRELYESINGIHETKAYGAERYRRLRFFKAIATRERSFIAGKSLSSAGEHVTQAITFLVSFVVITYGGIGVISGRLSLGELISFATIATYLLVPVNVTIRHALVGQQALASIQRLEECLALPLELGFTQTIHIKRSGYSGMGSLRYSHVSFNYPKQLTLLDEVDLVVEPGEVILITGPSGAGKTTLVNLLPRFLEPTSGKIYLDGIPITAMRLETLRKQIAFVSQDVFLFSDTVANNIRIANRHATDDEVRDAALIANALEFIEKLPNGFDTEVGQRGSRLSGGQRQRISIARALLKRAPVLVLDEATSAVDPDTEHLVHEALSRLMKNKTTIVIAHHPTAFAEGIHQAYSLTGGHLFPLSSCAVDTFRSFDASHHPIVRPDVDFVVEGAQ